MMGVQHYKRAIEMVRAYYPTDVFPDAIEGGKDEGHRRMRASASMARLTCDNIQKLAVELEAAEGE